MSRRHKKHEEHTNTEAWAIPYGDLVTLLLAFFVVMYAISSVNEGKYRVMSDSMAAAFNGAPRTTQPIQIGEQALAPGAPSPAPIVDNAVLDATPAAILTPISLASASTPAQSAEYTMRRQQNEASERQLNQVADQVENAMSDLVKRNLVSVRRHGLWVEVEIKTDILFPSGVATLSAPARKVLTQIADTIKPFPNAMRVEGHTDNRPISSSAFPSNWELSSARAASVVHLFTETGIDPARLAVIGLGEFRPLKANDTSDGRNTNRRVVLVILGGNAAPEGDYAGQRGAPGADTPATQTTTPAVQQSAPVNDVPAVPVTAAALSQPTTQTVSAN